MRMWTIPWCLPAAAAGLRITSTRLRRTRRTRRTHGLRAVGRWQMASVVQRPTLPTAQGMVRGAGVRCTTGCATAPAQAYLLRGLCCRADRARRPTIWTRATARSLRLRLEAPGRGGQRSSSRCKECTTLHHTTSRAVASASCCWELGGWWGGNRPRRASPRRRWHRSRLPRAPSCTSF